MRASYIYSAVFGFLLGILWQSVLNLNTTFVVFLVILGFFLLVILRFNNKGIESIIFIVLVIFSMVIGVVRMQVAQEVNNSNKSALNYLVGEIVDFKAVIVDEPDKRERNILLTVKSERGFKVLVKASVYGKYNYGDTIRVVGKLGRPQNFINKDNGKEFDYVGYLAKDGVHYIIKSYKITTISESKGFDIKARLFSIKRRYLDSLNSLIPEPQSALAGGITVGSRRALGQDLTEAFRNTGLIHIVVLSGFNITVIIIFLLRVLSWLPRVISYSFVGLMVILFAILTGADAPVVRASAMGILGVLALTLRRTYAITRALIIVASIMVFWNPYILVKDIAFQLSVVATLGLIYISPHITSCLSKKLPFWLSEIIGTTISAQIAVSPLLLFYMNKLSVVAVLVNVLVLPIIPLAMLVTFLAGFIGMFYTPIALPFAFGAHVMLSYVIWVVEVFNKLPFSTLSI